MQYNPTFSGTQHNSGLFFSPISLKPYFFNKFEKESYQDVYSMKQEKNIASMKQENIKQVPIQLPAAREPITSVLQNKIFNYTAEVKKYI